LRIGKPKTYFIELNQRKKTLTVRNSFDKVRIDCEWERGRRMSERFEKHESSLIVRRRRRWRWG